MIKCLPIKLWEKELHSNTMEILYILRVRVKIVAVASTKHALGIETEDGIEILIHVGLETAEFNGNGFELLVNQNDKVTIGQPLLKIDRDFFETHHTDLITPVVVTSKGLNIEFTNKEEVTIKDVVMMINR